MIKHIVFMGVPSTLSCDGNCAKAWGLTSRPKKHDDTYLSDDELDIAPIDPGTTEGMDSKPINATAETMNRWCARECERSNLVPNCK